MAKTPKVANIGLYNWLKDSGLTQAEVAAVCGITHQALSKIIVLGAMPSAFTLHALCSNYGLDYSEVCGWCNNAKKYIREQKADNNRPLGGQVSLFDL